MTGTGKLVIVAAIAGLALAACTGGEPIATETPSATVSAEPTATATTTPTPRPTGPLTEEQLLEILPPEATFPDTQGAIATAKYFLEEYPRMYATGDSRVWEALSLEECVFCADSLRGARETHADGNYREGGGFTFDDSRTVFARDPGTGLAYVTFFVTIEPSVTRSSDGTEVGSGDGGPGEVYVELVEVDGGWRISGVEARRD